jgi:hypothetical protein
MDRLIRLATLAGVVLVALVAAVVSFRHVHELAVRHGEDGLAAALIPLSVDDMIVAASMSVLVASRRGERGAFLTWTMLMVASLASLSVNVVVAEPSLIGRVIAAWPSFVLIGAYEMPMHQIRRSSPRVHEVQECQATMDGRRMVRRYLARKAVNSLLGAGWAGNCSALRSSGLRFIVRPKVSCRVGWL